MSQAVLVPSLGDRSAEVFGVKAYLDSHRRALLDLLQQREQAGVPFARRHAAIMDGLVQALFAGAVAGPARERSRCPLAFGAVGGYGRQHLGWKSDLDVRLITSAEPAEIEPVADAILYPLWDAGVSIGHQVISIAAAIEDAAHDLPTATALLDFRLLAGDTSLSATLEERAFSEVFAGTNLTHFLDKLRSSAAARLITPGRLGLPAGAGRQERRRRSARPGFRAVGGARALSREGLRRPAAARGARAARSRGDRTRLGLLVGGSQSLAPERGSALRPPDLRRARDDRIAHWATARGSALHPARPKSRWPARWPKRSCPTTTGMRASSRARASSSSRAPQPAAAVERRCAIWAAACRKLDGGVGLLDACALDERSRARAAAVRDRRRARAPGAGRCARRDRPRRPPTRVLRGAARRARGGSELFVELVAHVPADALAQRLDLGRAARRRAAAGDDPRVRPGGRPRAPRHLSRVHGRRALGRRRRSPARAGARRARSNASARVAGSPRSSARPRDALLRDAAARRRQGDRRQGPLAARRRDGARDPGPARPRGR